MLTNISAQISISEIMDKYDSYEHVQSFQETYPTHGMATSGNFFGLDTISYTNTKKNIFVELTIFISNDYMKLRCYDISDHNDWIKFHSVDSPSINDIVYSAVQCS